MSITDMVAELTQFARHDPLCNTTRKTRTPLDCTCGLIALLEEIAMTTTERDLLKAAGKVGADAIEACELLHQTLVAANDILKRYASREELIALDIEGALVAAHCIRMGGRSRPVSSSDAGAK